MRTYLVWVGLAAPFWIGAYVVAGWRGMAVMAVACVALELAVFRDEWVGIARRIARR